jgi:hypothetical protein
MLENGLHLSVIRGTAHRHDSNQGKTTSRVGRRGIYRPGVLSERCSLEDIYCKSPTVVQGNDSIPPGERCQKLDSKLAFHSILEHVSQFLAQVLVKYGATQMGCGLHQAGMDGMKSRNWEGIAFVQAIADYLAQYPVNQLENQGVETLRRQENMPRFEP